MPAGETAETDQGNGLALVAFCCANSSAQAGEFSRAPFQVDGVTVRLAQLACSSKLEVLHVLRALETGADAVILYTCPDTACRFGRGSIRAAKRIERAGRILAQIGMGSQRVCRRVLDPSKPAGLAQALKVAAAELAEIGPSPLKTAGAK